MSHFGKQTIGDQKRLVRGEQLLRARSVLRARDGVHHRDWRILMLAGGCPEEEIGAIRELMGKAHITALDKDQVCVDAARIAGVETALLCDLRADIPETFTFDLIDMDLCAGPSEETRQIFKSWRRQCTAGGVFIATFSYGRDVIEAQQAVFAKWQYAARPSTEREYGTGSRGAGCRNVLARLAKAGIPEGIQARLCSLFSVTHLRTATSIMLYRGNEMPMCSILFEHVATANVGELSFVQVQDGDYELAVVYPDTARLYATPVERIKQLRRQFAARKAVQTRQALGAQAKGPR